MAENGVTPSQAYIENKAVLETRDLVSELCRHFYTLGWVSGTGGSITIKVYDETIPKSKQLIVMSPSGNLSLNRNLDHLISIPSPQSVCVCVLGVQKEQMVSEDMYVLSSEGVTLSTPTHKGYPHKTPKCTDCASLFMKAYEMRNAGAVIHSHGIESCLVTMINPSSKEFRITHMEMIKGIQGHGYHDELVIPIIENTAHEGELTESLSEAIPGMTKVPLSAVIIDLCYLHTKPKLALITDSFQQLLNVSVFLSGNNIVSGHPCVIDNRVEHHHHDLELEIKAYPKATAVLVRNHGIYIWGDSWISAKTQAECYHYLFDAAIKLHQLGLDWSTPSHGPVPPFKGDLCGVRDTNGVVKVGALNEKRTVEPSWHCILLDIEGTTTPISFVTDVLFPYARENVKKHLTATFETEETRDDIELLYAQVMFFYQNVSVMLSTMQIRDDLKLGLDIVSIPPLDAGKEEVIASLVANVEEMIRADRKGHIWRTGYQNNELEGVVFGDVPKALEKWHASGIKVTYSAE
ncbi:hypothetical protein GIB67_039187 [Kingdonia uniflora]|uniref:Class II aldolase/adducin N-terminal domain-containing protein n=1 Tax=Kingdonia uniflora TaxID=39325 RepID=A0A7J7MLT4_9MAGN|nr:hypothetical protein GIB67_039187 [Kingdonia uniflora]